MAEAPFMVTTAGTSLMVLCHEDNCVCVRSPESFSDLEEVSRLEFSLPAKRPIKFISSHLDVNMGRPTKIRRCAWPDIRPYARKIAVSLDDEAPAAVMQAPAAPVAPNDVGPSQADESEVDEPPFPEQPRDAGEHMVDDEEVVDDLYEPMHHTDRSAALETSDNEIQEDNIANRTIIKQDYEEDKLPPAETVDQRRMSGFGRPSQLFDRESTPQSPALSSHDRKLSQEDTLAPKASPRSTNVLVTSPSAASKPARDSAPPEVPEASQIQPVVNPPVSNEKLLISIAHRPSKQQAMFHVRPSSRVSKVVAGACKSFRLDQDSAQLFLIVTMEEDGEEMEHLFECENGDTMARVGVEEGSSFIIKEQGLE